MKYSLQEDLSVLTNVSSLTWSKMNSKSSSLISHYIHEAKVSGIQDVSVDIGIGTIYIHIDQDQAQFRFEVSAEVQRKIQKTLRTGDSALIHDCEESLRDKFLFTYKELV